MSTHGLLKKPKKFFYGWWILLAGVVSQAVSAVMYNYGFGAFFLPISNEFGWSRAATAAPVGIARLEGAVLGPVEGYLIDKFGPRKLMFIGVIVMGAGFLLVSRMNSLLQFYLILIFKGLGSGIISEAVLVTVANWFRKRRGLSMGIVSGGLNIGAMMVPAVVWLIATRGWRSAAFIFSLITWAVLLPISLILRHRPEQYGYLPDGMSEEQVKAEEAESKRESALAEQNFTPRQAVSTPTFWLMDIAFAARIITVAAIPIHIIAFIQDIGYSAATGASIMALMAFCALIGRLGFGFLADVFPKKYMFAISLTGLAIAMLILYTAQSMWQLVLWAVIYGPGYGGGMPVQRAMVGDYFGRKFFGTIDGLTNILLAVGTVVGPVFAGYMFDVTGSYRLAFLTFAGIAAIGIVFILLAKRPRLPRATA